FDLPPPPPPPDSADAFAEFEDDLESEATQIDDSHLLAEQSTTILEGMPAQPFLAVEKGNDHGREFVLQEGENGVGRGIDNDVILADVAVSRRHLKIIRTGDTLKLRDLGSGNGTQVNGKKVHQTGLVDGDRIELGETVLVVRLPAAGAPPTDPYDADGVTDENQIGSSIPAPAASTTPSDPFSLPHGPGYQPELTPSSTATPSAPEAQPVAPKGAVVIPKPVFLAVLLGGVVLVGLLAVVTLVVVITSGEDEPEERVTLSHEESAFERGVSAYEAHDWDGAEAAFVEALEQGGSDPETTEYLENTRRAREHDGQLQQARAALSRGDLAGARSLAGRVPEASPLHADAEALLDRIAAREAETADGGDEGESEEGEAAADEEAAEEGEAPDGEEALAAEEAEREADDGASSSSRGRARRRGRGRSRSQLPRRVGGSSRTPPAFITAYLGGQFERAAQLARRDGDASMASRIESFGRLWRQAERARFGPSVRTQMERAIALDRNIARSDHYRGRLRRHVVNAYLRDARRQRRNPTASCTAVRHALRVDSSHADARQMASACEARARGMMSEAEGASPQRAMSIYGRILMMVPSNSGVAREARSRQQALRRRHSYDEDE
ncbi:MAG TPA: FHA domain-containing protein, partial [Sandaracinaceae bacterium LLY-WYZ-13_1]|nr:FHA domain-containing protein [Sandaracinaceae bacterium LLY-WYZ-13_1]